VLFLAVYQVMLPQMRALWISERLAQVARDEGCPAEKIASFPYQEPSLVFLVGTKINYILPDAAAVLLKQGGCALAFIDTRFHTYFETKASEIGLKYHAVATLSGFTYNGGRQVAITVYRSDEAAP
jgi:hypothetical protein